MQLQTVFFVALLASLLTLAQPQTLTINPASNIINQNVQYTFQITLGATGITPGTATLTFPATVFSFTNSSAITGCSNSIQPSTLYSCVASSANTISFIWTAAMPEGSSPLFLSINPLTNPPYVDNYTVSFDYAPDSGATFATISNTISGLQPDSLTSCAMTFSPAFTNSLSTITYTIVNKNSIPAGGSLQLTFNGYSPTNTSSLVVDPLTSSLLINSGATITSSSSVFFFSAFFSTLVAAGTTLTFSVGTITTPPTTSSSLYSITILTSATTSFLNKIDQSSCTISNIADFPTASLTASPTTPMKVGDASVLLNIDFQAPTLIDFSTDTIEVLVDSGSTSSFALNYLGIPVTTNVTSTGMVGASTTTGITFPTSSTPQTIASGAGVRITSGLFATSTVDSGSKTVSVHFNRSSNSFSSNTATVTISPNTLTAATLTPLSTTVSTATTYTFSMTTRNPLGVGAVVRITMPTTISIGVGSCTSVVTLSVVNALSSVITCSASDAQTIVVSNISNAVLPSGTVINISVDNINNPTSTKTISSLFYETFYSLSLNTNPVDDSTGFTLAFTPAPITIPSANFVASRVGTTNRQFTSYTFTYTVYTTFPANGYIVLTLPAAMVLSSGATANFLLSSTGVNSTLSMTSTSSLSQTSITLNFNALVTTILPTGTVFTITISNIQNYFSFKPVNIQMVAFTSDNFAVEQSDAAAVTLVNTITDSSLVVGTSNTATINGQTIIYNFTVTSPVDLTATDLISFEISTTNNINTQLAFTSSVSCAVGGTGTNCTKGVGNSNLLTVTTGTVLTANVAATVAVSSIVLTRAQDTPGNIIVNTFESAASGAFAISTFTLTPPANLNPNLITAASLSILDNGISSARLDQQTSFTLSISPTNTLISTDFIVVTVPTTWTNTQASMVVVTDTALIPTMSGSLCTQATMFCSNYLSDPHKIRVDDRTGTAFTSVTNLSFTLNSAVFASPKTFQTTYTDFSFETFSNTTSLIDNSQAGTVNTAAFSLACPNTTQYHCKTCVSSGVCTSCYQTGDGVDSTWDFGGFYVVQSTGQCVSSCGSNYFNQSNVCVQCTSPCFSCINSSTSTCSSCVSGFVLSGSECLSNCLTGFFNNSGTCSACVSPCVTCQTTSSTCLSCINNTFLNGNVCGSDCVGVSGTFADTATWTCAACIANCSQCSLSASNCTACASTYFLTGTNVCTQNCPTGTAKLNSTTCTCNFTVCLTCVVDINTCTSCQTGLVLLSTSCVASCGDGFYNNSNVCTACVTNCQTCNATSCNACFSTNPILYNNQCLTTCPTGTTQSANTCITCITGCNVCSSTTICTTCTTNFFLVIYNNGTTECTRPCPSTFPLQENGICVTACTAPLVASGTTCIVSNTTTITTNPLTSDSKVVPFPVTIGLAVLAIATLASKVALPTTILSASLAAFAGLTEIISWFVFIISAAVDANSTNLGKIGLYVVLIAYILTLVLNIIGIIFFKKYLWPDEKFQNHYKKLSQKTKCGVSVTYIVFILGTSLSHKIIEILFSNIFQTNYFLYKVTQVNKFTPLNYIRYISIVPTIVAIVGAGIANYEVQTLKLTSFLFVQSIDLIIVTILAAITAIWATIRSEGDYENVIEKKNDIEEELEHDPIEDDVNQQEFELKDGLRRKHVTTSSLRYTNEKNSPLQARNRNRNKNPLGEEYNVTTNPLNNDEEDLERIDISDSNQPVKKRLIGNGIAVDQIGFEEESGVAMMGNNGKQYDENGNTIEKGGKRNKKGGKRGRGKGKGNRAERQRLKEAIQNKLTPEERQKARVVGEVDSINTVVLVGNSDLAPESSQNLKDLPPKEAKKQKLNVLQKTPGEDLQKLPEGQREKAEEIKEMMNLLQSKKINIADYLDYLEIIEEENQDKNSSDYQNMKLDHKFKDNFRVNKKNQKNQKNKNLAKSIKKMDRKERSARYHMDPHLMISHMDDPDLGNTFDEEAEPQPPDFHGTPIRGRNHSQNFEHGDLEELKLSGPKTSNNKSEQMFKKQKPGVNDMVVVSLDSGDNDDPSLQHQFQRGNTLKQVQKDEAPPSNMFNTQKLADNKNRANINSFPLHRDPFSKDKITKNKLINDDDNIQYIQSEGGSDTLAGQLIEFNNDISPSHFDEPNLRIENDETSNVPSKPKVHKKANYDNNDEVLEVEDLEDVEDLDQFEQGQSRKGGMNRYQSDRNLDYDDILYQKHKKQKMKQLEQIYLPRQEVPRATRHPKKRMNQSTNSYRIEDK